MVNSVYPGNCILRFCLGQLLLPWEKPNPYQVAFRRNSFSIKRVRCFGWPIQRHLRMGNHATYVTSNTSSGHRCRGSFFAFIWAYDSERFSDPRRRRLICQVSHNNHMQSDKLLCWRSVIYRWCRRYAAGRDLQEPAYASLTEGKNELHHQKH